MHWSDPSDQVNFEKVKAGEGNTNDAYCYHYIPPKIEKVREKFSDKVKESTTD